MEKEKTGITVAGSLNADIFYKIDTYPAQGLLTKIRETAGHVGGTGNLILDLAKMDPGLPVKASAVVGEDAEGEMIVDKLSAFPNVDVSGISRRGESSITLVMNAEDTKQRTFFFRPAASDIYGEHDIDWEKADAKIFHLEYLLLMKKVDSPDNEYGTHGARILHEAQQRGMKTSIDIVSEQSERARTVVSYALKYTDYCIINEVEAEAVTQIPVTVGGKVSKENVYRALQAIAQQGVRTWVVVHAPACSYGYDCRTKEFVISPSLILPDGYIKGTNGAGDAYCSGILYGAYHDMTLKDSMRYASACAACSLSEENGTDGMRHAKEIWEVEKRYRKSN